VHHELELNVLGRKGPMPLVTDEEGNETEDPNEPEAVPPLRALSDDAPEGDCWSFRVCPGGAGEAKSSLVVARSLLWPGAYALAFGRKFLNVYVGSGNKYTASTYTPPPPRTVLGEWAPAEQCSPLSEQADITQDPTPSKEGQDEEE
jgi:radial spoke head protein 4A